MCSVENPYKKEIISFEPSQFYTETKPELPAPVEKSQETFVTTEKGLDELLNHLESVKIFGVDLEHHQLRSYQGKL